MVALIRLMAKKLKGPLGLFYFAQIVVFSMITLLQFVKQGWFFLVLLMMHGGIVLLIVSKKWFSQFGFTIKPYLKRIYQALALFLLIMFYQVGSLLFTYEVDESLKMIATFVILFFVLIVSVITCAKMMKSIKFITTP